MREIFKMETNILLSDLLRPKRISDLNLPIGIAASLERMEKANCPMNFIFYGAPGIGKTSAARILIQNSDVFELNGSFNNGDKTTQKAIEQFASHLSLEGKPKVVFIDEADYVTKEVQAGLRYIIERFSNTTRFILTANEIGKITPAVQSRCLPICFDVAPRDRSAVIERMLKRYEIRLDELGIPYDPKRLNEIVGIHFPDLRDIANRIELEFRT